MTGRWVGLALVLGALLPGAARAAEDESGFFAEVRVRAGTRLDWESVVSAFPRADARVSSAYDPRTQRYQLFVPATYRPGGTWPLVLFVSPGDDPLGWRAWRKVCEEKDLFFCAAYGAGSNSTPGRRVRVILDVFDDLRRRYRIDPERTYLAGLSSGAGLASALAFALPDYFGGVIAVGGSAPLPRLAHLRQRVRGRLSLALVAGASDPVRRELELLRAPLFTDLGLRTKLWVVPRRGVALPPQRVVAEVHTWLEADLKRRRADARSRPGLAASADGVTSRRLLAARTLALAEAELRKPGRVYRAVSLLEAAAVCYDRTVAGEKAARRLKEVRADARYRKALKEQAGAEERRTLGARARARERFGQVAAALRDWQALVKDHAGSLEGKKAVREVKRLTALLARTPYLGAAFAGDTTAIRQVVPGGPAHRAGLRRGDRVVQVGKVRVGTLADLRTRFGASKPGDNLNVAVRRAGKTVTLTVRVGAAPAE
jgi:hypothetical protein